MVIIVTGAIGIGKTTLRGPEQFQQQGFSLLYRIEVEKMVSG